MKPERLKEIREQTFSATPMCPEAFAEVVIQRAELLIEVDRLKKAVSNLPAEYREALGLGET
jgi:hypothetical protein